METEKRMIEANTLREEISSLRVTVTGLRAGKGVLNDVMNQYRESVLRIIDEQPTADAVEVVHGYTLIADEPKKVLLDRKCGICDQLMLATDNYCPMCGAINDGEKI